MKSWLWVSWVLMQLAKRLPVDAVALRVRIVSSRVKMGHACACSACKCVVRQ